MRKNVGSILIETKTDNDSNVAHLLNGLAYRADINFSLFTPDFSVVMNQPKFFTILPLHEAKLYFGSLFVWDLIKLDLITSPPTFPNLEKILFYQNADLPWMRNKNVAYSTWNRFFNNPRVQIFTDNMLAKDIINNTWNSNCKFIHQINPDTLYEIL